MHLGRFDLNLLVALDALLREKNVTRAAERVFVAQPTMSLALAKLRYHFSDPLLVRVGRELELTARGLALVEPVRETLLRAQAVLGTQAAFDASTVRRTFRMMIPDFIAPSVLPRILQRLVEWAPGVRLQMENWSVTGPAQVINGDIDLLVTLDSPNVIGLERLPESLCRATLRSQRWVCAVSSDHPLLQTQLTRERFLGLPHISLRIPGDRQPIDEAVRKRLNVELDVRVATDSVLQMPFLLAGTTLIAVLPEDLARQLTGCLSIRILDIPDDIVPARHVELLWHRRNEPDPAHAWMRDVLREAATAR